jgi:hypothetical protein
VPLLSLFFLNSIVTQRRPATVAVNDLGSERGWGPTQRGFRWVARMRLAAKTFLLRRTSAFPEKQKTVRNYEFAQFSNFEIRNSFETQTLARRRLAAILHAAFSSASSAANWFNHETTG